MKTVFKMPENKCPRCGATLDSAYLEMEEGSEPPAPGDLSLCDKCSLPLVFGENLVVHEMTFEEFKELSDETKVLLSFAKVEQYHRIMEKQ